MYIAASVAYVSAWGCMQKRNLVTINSTTDLCCLTQAVMVTIMKQESTPDSKKMDLPIANETERFYACHSKRGIILMELRLSRE